MALKHIVIISYTERSKTFWIEYLFLYCIVAMHKASPKCVLRSKFKGSALDFN
jgi:hypothetical protein